MNQQQQSVRRWRDVPLGEAAVNTGIVALAVATFLLILGLNFLCAVVVSIAKTGSVVWFVGILFYLVSVRALMALGRMTGDKE